MQKKISKKILASIVDGCKEKKQISQNRVTMIANKMNRSQVKQLIKALRADMLKNAVFIETADKLSDFTREHFKSFYPNKKVDFSVDPELLLGYRVTNNDLVYQGDLQSRLTEILEGIKNDERN